MSRGGAAASVGAADDEHVGRRVRIAARPRDDGFEHEGATYRSLSQLARRISGAASINGFLFFGLTGSKKPTPKPPKGTPEQVASVAKARAARAAKVAARRAAKASS